MATQNTKWLYNGHNVHKIYQQLLLQDTSKWNQIGIFGLKKNIWQHFARGRHM
jgi:hypothetical protein